MIKTVHLLPKPAKQFVRYDHRQVIFWNHLRNPFKMNREQKRFQMKKNSSRHSMKVNPLS